MVEHLVTHDAELKFVPRRPDKLPLTFKIHELRLDVSGFDRAIPFYDKTHESGADGPRGDTRHVWTVAPRRSGRDPSLVNTR